MADYTRADFALANSVRVGVPSSWLPVLGTLKVAGTLGLLLAIAALAASFAL
ncbi:DoxX family protein [Actinomadura nitritigenes]|uniref:DoxX family protein n=1 Tax=Actinomadura nitritigenes TaxID=134602 RepID=UPI003D94FE5A